MEANEIHERIINILREKGPSLPIHVAKELEMSSLFISAFLSELSNQRRVRMSHLRVGGSPLYYLENQEELLEPYHKYMHPKEAETFLLLKKKKVLKDSEQEPATRVALRSIRDFAIGFKVNEEIFWRYILVSEKEARELLSPRKEKVEREEEKKKEEKKEEKIRKKVEKVREKEGNEFKNPLVIQAERSKKQKPKSNFVLKVIDFIRKKGLEIVEELDYKAREYNCKILIKSELGNIIFLTQAKDKKIISETDLKKLLSNAQSIPLPAFILYTGDISKKAKEYLREYGSILKAKKIM